MKLNAAVVRKWREQGFYKPEVRGNIFEGEWVELCTEALRGIEAYPRLVQALRNLAGAVPRIDNAYVWAEYRRTARVLLKELGETEGEADLRAVGEALSIPEFLRKAGPSHVEMLAAVIAGQMIGASGYRPGVMVDAGEAAGDALAIAGQIVAQATAGKS